jgi:hypothetical protein
VHSREVGAKVGNPLPKKDSIDVFNAKELMQRL